jgi:hypothetical protein
MLPSLSINVMGFLGHEARRKARMQAGAIGMHTARVWEKVQVQTRNQQKSESFCLDTHVFLVNTSKQETQQNTSKHQQAQANKRKQAHASKHKHAHTTKQHSASKQAQASQRKHPQATTRRNQESKTVQVSKRSKQAKRKETSTRS